MSLSFSSPTLSTFNQPSLIYRLRYYGIGAVLALSFMLLGRCANHNDGLALVYLPFVAATLLVMALACTPNASPPSAKPSSPNAKKPSSKPSNVSAPSTPSGRPLPTIAALPCR